MKSYQEISDDVVKLLKDNDGWIKRYKSYVNKIEPNSTNAHYVNAVIKSFRAEEPLTKYISIGKVRDVSKEVTIDLRINGHSVAEYITELTDDVKEAIDNKEYSTSYVRKIIRANSYIVFKRTGLEKVAQSDETISKEFYEAAEKYDCKKVKWTDKPATEFRKLIKEIDTKSVHSEHTLETQLLKRLSAKSSKGKPICSIQPIRLCGAFFQLVTPLKASEVESTDLVYYSKDKNGHESAGGGIDILARIKNENNQPEICVIELKDEYRNEEKPTRAIKQAIAYATFLDTLIREEESLGSEWYKEILGIKKDIRDIPIKINAVVAMPYRTKECIVEAEDREMAGQVVQLENGDKIELHYFFFDKESLYDEDIKPAYSLKTWLSNY